MKRWIIIGILVGLCISLFWLSSNTNAQLHTVKAEFNSTQAELDLTRTELEATKGELDSTETELALTKGELDSTKTGLEATSIKLGTTEVELQSTKEELHSVETELASTLDSLSTIQAELDVTRDTLTDLEISYEGLMTGHGYIIKDPTYNEMMRFLKADDTDEAEYIKGEYECTEFATDLCNSAEEEGIRCAYVTLKFPRGVGHAIVAFDTIDKGLIYIEPQYDDLVKVEIGKYFHKCVVPGAGYLFEKPDFDDTIEEILIAW
jgi:hypothetical protein